MDCHHVADFQLQVGPLLRLLPELTIVEPHHQCASRTIRNRNDAGFHLLVAVTIDRGGAGVGGGLDERPAQILGPLFGERAAQVAFA